MQLLKELEFWVSLAPILSIYKFNFVQLTCQVVEDLVFELTSEMTFLEVQKDKSREIEKRDLSKGLGNYSSLG